MTLSKAMLYPVLGLSVLFCALSGWAQTPTRPAAPAPAVSVPVEVLQRFNDSRIRSPEQQLLRSPGELNAFWARHGTGSPPEIDFRQFWLIATVLGERPTTGFSACTQQVHRQQDLLVVTPQADYPDPNRFLAQVKQSPGCLVRIPRQSTLRAEFKPFNVAPVERILLPMRTLAQSSNSLITDRRLVIMRDADSFRQLWQAHSGLNDNVPTVAFEREMVVAIFMGEQPTGGYSLNISGIEETPTELVVRYQEKRPSSDQMVIQMLTAPAHWVAIPKRDTPIRFEAVTP